MFGKSRRALGTQGGEEGSTWLSQWTQWELDRGCLPPGAAAILPSRSQAIAHLRRDGQSGDTGIAGS